MLFLRHDYDAMKHLNGVLWNHFGKYLSTDGIKNNISAPAVLGALRRYYFLLKERHVEYLS